MLVAFEFVLVAVVLSAVAVRIAQMDWPELPRTEAAIPLEEWAHGFKTDYVVATRYTGLFGQTIGFAFPKHKNDCDSAGLHDWLTENAGVVLDFGGSPGAEARVVLYDGESTNDKLKRIVPALTEFMRRR